MAPPGATAVPGAAIPGLSIFLETALFYMGVIRELCCL
jgi:hypothetical protein